MSTQSEQDREARALEALIVSQLRRERNPADQEDLPQLTDEDRKAMNALGPNLIDRLWDSPRSDEEGSHFDDCDEELACAGEQFAGMNRAEEIDEETKRALDAKRAEVRERLRKKKLGSRDENCA